jgi:hypothetical protein
MHGPQNSGVRRPAELSAHWHQGFSAERPVDQIGGAAICAPRFGGAHRLVHPVRGIDRIRCKPLGQAGFRPISRKPSIQVAASRTQNCVVWNQGLTGYAPHHGAKPFRRTARRNRPDRLRFCPSNTIRVWIVLFSDCSETAHSPYQAAGARGVPALLNAENTGIGLLNDLEIARCAGVSPQTVGIIRRSR